MSPEGKPIQVNASALQAASAQNTMGMLEKKENWRHRTFSRIVNKFWRENSFLVKFNDDIKLP